MGPDPPENHKRIEFLSNTSLNPLKNHKATRPANVGPSLAQQNAFSAIWILSPIITKKVVRSSCIWQNFLNPRMFIIVFGEANLILPTIIEYWRKLAAKRYGLIRLLFINSEYTKERNSIRRYSLRHLS